VKPFTPEGLEQPLRDLADALDVRVGPLFGILRGAVTGQRVSPPLFESMSILRRERTLQQVDKGIELLHASVRAETH
jgi:glutamyl-tRNA synthetase